MSDLPTWRLHLLRAMYLLMVLGLGVFEMPDLFVHPAAASGVVTSMLAGFWLLALFGLFHPLRMLPVLLLEFAWKTIWVLAFGLPLWRAGLLTPATAETFKAVMMGVILTPLVIPWGYVARHYLTWPRAAQG